MYSDVPIDDLPQGAILAHPIYDARGVKLLDAGVEISRDFLQKLRQHGNIYVQISEPEPKVDSEKSQVGRITCNACSVPLGLRIRRKGEISARWECVGCGHEFTAVLDLSLAPEARRSVRLASSYLRDISRDSLPPAIENFVRDWANENSKHDERRRSPRRQFLNHVIIIALSDKFVPIGGAFEAVTYNISQHGIGIVHSRAIQGEYLIAELPSPEGGNVQILSRIVRCRSLGQFYEIGCEFLAKLGKHAPSKNVD